MTQVSFVSLRLWALHNKWFLFAWMSRFFAFAPAVHFTGPEPPSFLCRWGEKHRGELLQACPSWSFSGNLGGGVSTNATGFSAFYIWARLTARLYENQPSPVLNACGLAVWLSFMMPKPSS